VSAIERRRADALAACGLLLLALLLFRRAVFAGEALFERDLGFWYYSQVESIVRIAGSGSWPLWDPYMAFGMPLLANPSAQILYPFTLLHALSRAVDLLHALRRLPHAAHRPGAYALARRFGISALGAFVAACAWMASGPLLSLVNMWHHFAGAAWIPWTLFAAERACAGHRVRDALFWAAALGGQILTGSADMCVLSAAGGLAVLASRVRWARLLDPANGRLLRTAALAWSLALGATAAQWLPALDMLRGAQRSALPEVVRTQWSVHPLALLQLLVPALTKGLPLQGVEPRLAQETEIPLLYSLYLGVGVLALAGAGLGDASWAPRRLFGALLAGAALVALGRHAFVYPALVALFPPLGVVRFPVKALVLAALAAAVLAGRGSRYLAQRRRGGRARAARRARSRGAAGPRLRRLGHSSRSAAGTAGWRCRCATRRGSATCSRATCTAPQRRPAWRWSSVRSRSGAGRPTSRRRSRSRSSWP
jgi:hypothetical protein